MNNFTVRGIEFVADETHNEYVGATSAYKFRADYAGASFLVKRMYGSSDPNYWGSVYRSDLPSIIYGTQGSTPEEAAENMFVDLAKQAALLLSLIPPKDHL